jgi:hypothetical protein
MENDGKWKSATAEDRTGGVGHLLIPGLCLFDGYFFLRFE